jgi:leader peptidase (prepilin peptidase)/N-methyltransferase
MVTWQVHAILTLGMFAIGAVVGSFLNVCIYRIPWQKSVIWPASRCPSCWAPIAPQDNIPVISWVALRGECRQCGSRIAARYPLIEALVGLLFAGVYVADVVYGPKIPWGPLPAVFSLRLAYHASLVALLVAATFIDYDLTLIPDQVTVPGMLVGLGLGAIFPEVRPEPSTATTHWDGLLVGLAGWLVGGGLTWFVRFVGTLALRREAMGFGDVTLMAMIGAYLGWQAAVLTFFIAPFFGLSHALAKAFIYVGKRLSGRRATSADREIPFGPYLSMAAVALLLSWPWLWPGWARQQFKILGILFGIG